VKSLIKIGLARLCLKCVVARNMSELCPHSVLASTAKIAGLLLLVVAAGLGATRLLSFRSHRSRVIAGLDQACAGGRLTAVRTSALAYAPTALERGEEPRLDEAALRQAELAALDEVDARPTAASFDILGKVYLSERSLDKAADCFMRATRIGGSSPEIQCDLGAALLERYQNQQDLESRGDDLVQALEHLDTALAFNTSLPEALFNRALLKELCFPFEDAEAAWQDYLGKDATSPWANEARSRLLLLHSLESMAALQREPDPEDFVSAVRSGDEQKAWAILSRNRARTGNRVIATLLDQYLEAAARDLHAEAEDFLTEIRYAGDLEAREAADRYSSDLAAYYTKTNPTQRALVSSARSQFRQASQTYASGEWDEAAGSFAHTSRTFAKVGNRCEAMLSEFWEGACYLRTGDSAHALPIFATLTDLADRLSYRWLKAQSVLCIAEALSSRGEYSGMLESASASLEISRAILDRSGELRGMQAQVAMCRQVGDFRKSIGYALRALERAKQFSLEPKEVWPFYQHISNDLYWLGYYSGAREFEEAALELAARSGISFLEFHSHETLALIHQKLGDTQIAINEGETALKMAESVTGVKSKADSVASAALNLGHLYREMGEFDRAVHYYNQAIDLHQGLGLQFYTLEARKGKLESLLALGNERAIQEEIETAVKLLEDPRGKIKEDGNRNRYFELAQGIYDAAIDFAYSHLNDERKAFEYSEASRGRSLLDMLAGAHVVKGSDGFELQVDRPASPLTITQIQRRLPVGTRILEYAVLEDKVIAWVISRGDVKSAYSRFPSADLTEQVTRFREAITRQPRCDPQDVAAKGKALYNSLISPVEAFLDPKDTVFIVPDKTLNFLPFAALVSPASGRYFIEDFTSALTPSATIMIRCSEQALKKQGRRTETALCIGNPSFDRVRFSSLPNLECAEREARSVAAVYGSVPPLIGREAKADLVKQRMSTADMVHFAGHYLIERSPLESRLLLASDTSKENGGSLTAAELYGMTLRRARLVVLSACQTAVEHSYAGEGAVGIARPFIRAGVPVVTATMWPVEDGRVNQLMIDFHTRRKLESLESVRALRQAQLDILQSSDEDERDPSSWAAFVAIGGFTTF
jgi:CHAT domain-containing protein/tetratricopeptide (TPR) repeat protein